MNNKLILSLMFYFLVTYSQADTCSLSGNVKYGSSEFLQTHSDKFSLHCMSDRNGFYEFKKIKCGKYYIRY